MPLSPIARKRLHAIFSASDLGAGYQIALSDLEIRGAGNILGAEQHGFMAAVGFEMYTRMLAEAVDMLRGQPAGARAVAGPPRPAGLGVPARRLRRRLGRQARGVPALRRRSEPRPTPRRCAPSCATDSARFRPPVEGLFTAVRVRLAAEAAGVPEVRAEERQVTLKWARVRTAHAVSVALQVAGLRPDDRVEPGADPGRRRAAIRSTSRFGR